MSENVSTSSAAKLPSCQYNKAALKLEGFVTNAATYYLTSVNGNKQILLIRLSLNPPPAALQL